MTQEFKKVALWGRFSDADVAERAQQIAKHLTAKAIEVFVSPSSADLQSFASYPRIPEEGLASRLDLIIAIGGDGTLLNAARLVAGEDVPLLGVNLGRLGFLTDISPDQVLTAIDAILSGDSLADQRLLLEATIVDGNDKQVVAPMLALNDVVLQQTEAGRMLGFVTEVDGVFVNSHSGDGLIVATPTGSTAYALSCAGPIIQPDVDALLMVPICPHSLSDRPVVLRSSSAIEITVESPDEVAQVTCDGAEFGTISANHVLRISAAKETVTLLHPTDYNYYELLRSKLNWGSNSRRGRSKSRS